MKLTKSRLLLCVCLTLLGGCYPEEYSRPKSVTPTPDIQPAGDTISSFKIRELDSIVFGDYTNRTVLTITANGKIIVADNADLNRDAQEFFKILEKNWFNYSLNECEEKWGYKQKIN